METTLKGITLITLTWFPHQSKKRVHTYRGTLILTFSTSKSDDERVEEDLSVKDSLLNSNR